MFNLTGSNTKFKIDIDKSPTNSCKINYGFMDDTPTNFPLNKSKDRLDRIIPNSLLDEYIHHRFKADAGKQ